MNLTDNFEVVLNSTPRLVEQALLNIEDSDVLRGTWRFWRNMRIYCFRSWSSHENELQHTCWKSLLSDN